ncbi:MAG: HEAT repeat domain-containing protein, partial [Candidatus Anstonellales archaeon]
MVSGQTTIDIDQLIENLKSPYEDVRKDAAGAIGKIAEKGGDCSKAVPALIEVLKDESKEVRREAAWALGNIGDKRAVPALIEALKDEDALVRANAAEALRKIGKPAVPYLIEALKDESKEVRVGAAEALVNAATYGSKAQKTEVLNALIDALGSEDVTIRANAAWVLGKIAADRIDISTAIPELGKLLEDENEKVRRNAGWALRAAAEQGNNKALDALKKGLENENADVRRSAVEAIGLLGSLSSVGSMKKWALDALIEALKHETDIEVKVNTARWVLELSAPSKNEDALNVLIDALGSEDNDVKKAAAEALGEAAVDGIDISTAVPKLENLLEDENADADVKKAAAEALGEAAAEALGEAAVDRID